MRVLERIWWEYPFVVDFLLYFFFFGALVRAALTRHFGDVAAKRIAISLGLCLSVGLTMAQDRLDFALEDLGPLAIVLIVLTLGIVVFRLLLFADVPKAYAGLFASLFVLVGFRALELDFWRDELRFHPDYLTLGVIVSALLAWHFSNGGTRPLPLDRVRSVAVPSRKELVGKRASVAREASSQKRDVVSRGKVVERELDEAKAAVSGKSKGVSTVAFRRLLVRVEEEASRVTANLSRVRRFDRALRDADWAWLKKSLKVDVGGLSIQERRALKGSVAMERARLGVEERIDSLAGDAESHTLRVREFLRRAEDSLGTLEGRNLEKWLGDARSEQARANTLSKEILAQERILQKLFKKQVRILG